MRKDKSDTICLNCKSLVPYSRNTTGKYCNNQCQADHKFKKVITRIESGEEFSAKVMKRYLIHKYGSICMSPECGWDWSIEIGVDLDHINGISDDNSLSNLRLLCPNCHSMTDTYKGKNVGNGRHSRRNRYAEGKSY